MLPLHHLTFNHQVAFVFASEQITSTLHVKVQEARSIRLIPLVKSSRAASDWTFCGGRDKDEP